MSQGDDYQLALMLQEQLNSEPGPNSSALSGENKDSDYQMALKLQALLDSENEREEEGLASDFDISLQFVYPSKQAKTNTMSNGNTANTGKGKPQPPVRAIQASHDEYLNQTVNLVHPQWELVDPTPDIFSMFVRFDEKFFQKRLGAVALEWSKRMYSCAGICYQRGNRFAKEVTIRLSEPLLKLRPRKDLVETLLHEMIHAYCFILNIREGNGGHGPNFKRMMETINKVAGTNISVYHTFHDEVAAYRTHIWRCTGICQERTPFQGYVKRTANRPPGPSDQWWEKHTRECGGTFMKVGEPSKPAKPPKLEAKPRAKKAIPPPPVAAPKDDIRNWLGKPAAKKPATEAALLGNLVAAVPPTSYPGLSTDPFVIPKPPAAAKPRTGTNIVSFGDLNSSSGEGDDQPAGAHQPEMSGQGYSVGRSSSGVVIDITGTDSLNPTQLRNMRLQRFGQVSSTQKSKADADANPDAVANVDADAARKRRRASSDSDIVSWESYDDDVMIKNVEMPVIDLDDSDSDEEQQPAKEAARKPGARHTMSSLERTQIIKREVMEDESSYSEDDILFIDDEYDDGEAAAAASDASLTAATELADQSIIDDLFGEDTLLEEFQRENSVLPSCSNYSSNVDNDIVSCPICFEKMKRTQLANHFEGCSITVRVEFKAKWSQPSATASSTSKPSTSRRSQPKPKPKSKRAEAKQILRDAGYTNTEIDELNLSSSSESATVLSSEDDLTPRQRRQRSLFKQTVFCPKCGQELMGHQMKVHRSVCQANKR
ncbi:uncharacterized protein LOC108137738 isoform X2 [Drosophila elegans]|uniref:uncharacterized protein LOC108137738 isoform X2 n=1 Tax=Drosophila elegans TaxID=30023 RepID=UPI0007E7A87D|nr:uncharacterized protein LOC108137738 isoform X2 [Drosophila elegans]